MTTTSIALDMGSSLLKVIYGGKGRQAEPLALRPEVANVTPEQIRAHLTEYHDDPLRSAFVEIGQRLYALGDFAVSSNGVQYHELSKWSDVMPRILGVLGLIAHRLDTTQFIAC